MTTRPMAGRSALPPVLAAVRPRQWVKNLLVVLAPAGAGVLFTPAGLRGVALSFVAMTAAASSTYLVNDVRDREADASHPTKQHRPVAAGRLAPGTATGLAVVLAVVGLGVPLVVDRPVLAMVVAAYLLLTLAYSTGLKHVRLLELFVVAAGFVLRAIAGAVAVDVPVSAWFLIVVSAAAVHVVATKRYAEKRDQDTVGRPVLVDYDVDVLSEVRYSSAAVALVGYLLWAFEMHDGGVPWFPLSAAPFALTLFEYGSAVHDGAGEAPEDVLLGGGAVLGYAVAWAALFVVGTLVAP